MNVFSLSEQSAAQQTGLEPAEAYIDWMRNDLASGKWQADPTQPCLLYKVYNSVERVALEPHIPLRLGMSYQDLLQGNVQLSSPVSPDVMLSCLLYYVHGLTRVLRPEAGVSSLRPRVKGEAKRQETHFSGPSAHSSPFLGRPVPSGGSLHPVELYLALGSGWPMPAGIYHYDSAHHALERLREGDFGAAIARCLLEPGVSGPGSLSIFPTVCFQKNHQKYTNLSYWLQTLDAGVLIEQLHVVARCLRLALTTSLRYLDQPLHHLLGLDTGEEQIYAVLSLRPEAAREQPEEARPIQDIAALPALQATHCQPFAPRPRSALLTRLYEASLLYQPDKPSEAAPVESPQGQEGASQAFVLPPSHPSGQQDIAQTLLRRRTGMNALASSPLQLTELAAVLAPLREHASPVLETCQYQLYCVASRVDTLPPGVYRYRQQTLVPVHQEHILPILSRITTGINIFPHLAPLNLFLCADYQRALRLYGPRGLRMLGIEMGRVLQRLTLAAAASNLATHIHQSLHIEGTRKVLLRLVEPGQLPLATMMIGHEKSVQGGLFETIWY